MNSVLGCKDIYPPSVNLTCTRPSVVLMVSPELISAPFLKTRLSPLGVIAVTPPIANSTRPAAASAAMGKAVEIASAIMALELSLNCAVFMSCPFNQRRLELPVKVLANTDRQQGAVKVEQTDIRVVLQIT